MFLDKFKLTIVLTQEKIDILLEEYNLHMSCHEYCASHVSASSISASTLSKPGIFISSRQSSLFQESTNNMDVEIFILLLKN